MATNSSPLRRKLAAALSDAVDYNDADEIVDKIMNVLIHEPLMVVLSGLSEEVINRKRPGLNEPKG
jgi:predicted Zn-dependent protease with MMP-like domain